MRHHVGPDGPRGVVDEVVAVVVDVVPRGDERGADVRVGAHAGRRVRVLMRVDQVPDRLVRDLLDDRLDDAEAEVLAAGSFVHRDPPREFDGDALVAAGFERVHAVGQLRHRRIDLRLVIAHVVGHGHRVGADVRFDVLHGAAERIVAGVDRLDVEIVVEPFVRVPAGGELDAVADVDVALVGELVLVVQVAKHRVECQRVHALKHVLLVDRRVDLPSTGRRDLHDVGDLRNHGRAVTPHLAQLPAPRRLRVRTRHLRRLEETMRVHPQLDGEDFRDVRLVGNGLTHRAVHVPRVDLRARRVEHEDLMRLFLNGAIEPADAVFPGGRRQARLPVELLLHRLGLPVHRADVVAKLVRTRPVDVLAGLFLLADGAVVPLARDGDAIELVVPDRLDRGVENRLGINKARRKLLRGDLAARQRKQTSDAHRQR